MRCAALLALVFFAPFLTTGGPATARAALDPGVETRLRNTAPGETLTVLVELKSQADLDSIRGEKEVRQREVVERLEAKADAAQEPLLARLARDKATGKVKKVVALWISNSVAVTATPGEIEALAARPEVAAITPNETIPEPVMPTATTATTPEANLDVIGAPALWDLGITGSGVVVASMDTGVDAGHPDLSTRWRGGTNSWFDPSGEHPSVPTDRSGHGTWTMGVMVGGSAGGTAIGVAPDARWISAKIFNDRGYATTVGIHQSFQWLLDPDGDPTTPDAPDVVNASWSMADPGCYLEFQPDLQALLAANILPVFAAGNYGPNASTSVSPANYPEALAVGAATNSDAIYQYSSRGPSGCGEDPNTFPEVVAPGVGIRSTDLLGTYATATGTSMSAPHAAGTLALLLSTAPDLTTAEQREALTGSAVDLGPAGPDNDYGHGRIDALAAYEALKSTSSVDSLITGKRKHARFIPKTRFKAGKQVVIRAHVVDGEGQNLGDAAVELTVRGPDGDGVAELSASTGADGMADFVYGTDRESPGGRYTVEVTTVNKTGYEYSPGTVSTSFALR